MVKTRTREARNECRPRAVSGRPVSPSTCGDGDSSVAPCLDRYTFDTAIGANRFRRDIAAQLSQRVHHCSPIAADAQVPSSELSLLQFQYMLGQSLSQDPDEQEFIMAMLKSWEEGKAEARAEAWVEARVETVLTVLRVRGIEVPAAARERILAQKDINQLTRWLEKAAVTSTIREVIDEPS